MSTERASARWTADWQLERAADRLPRAHARWMLDAYGDDLDARERAAFAYAHDLLGVGRLTFAQIGAIVRRKNGAPLGREATRCLAFRAEARLRRAADGSEDPTLFRRLGYASGVARIAEAASRLVPA